MESLTFFPPTGCRSVTSAAVRVLTQTCTRSHLQISNSQIKNLIILYNINSAKQSLSLVPGDLCPPSTGLRRALSSCFAGCQVTQLYFLLYHLVSQIPRLAPDVRQKRRLLYLFLQPPSWDSCVSAKIFSPRYIRDFEEKTSPCRLLSPAQMVGASVPARRKSSSSL